MTIAAFPYEILLRGTDDGTSFRGAYYINAVGDTPTDITIAELSDFFDTNSAGYIARIIELEGLLETCESGYNSLAEANGGELPES